MQMQYIPKNKKTGIEYPAISQEEKDAYEAPTSAVKGKYAFRPVAGAKPAPIAPPPIEAKPVKEKTVVGDTTE
jgi:hypothetical protein